MTPIRRLAADQSGASLVELALVLPLFLALLIGVFQIAILEAMSVNFNNAVLQAARHIRTNDAGRAPDAAKFRQAICEAMAGGGAGCTDKVRIIVQKFGGFAGAANPPPVKDGEQPYDPGDAGDVVLVTATYRWPMFMPFAAAAFPRQDGLNVLITSRTLFRNEPWDAD